MFESFCVQLFAAGVCALAVFAAFIGVMYARQQNEFERSYRNPNLAQQTLRHCKVWGTTLTANIKHSVDRTVENTIGIAVETCSAANRLRKRLGRPLS